MEHKYQREEYSWSGVTLTSWFPDSSFLNIPGSMLSQGADAGARPTLRYSQSWPSARRLRDLEKGTESHRYIYELPSSSQTTEVKAIAAPKPAHVRGCKTPSDAEQASNVSSSSTLALPEEREGREIQHYPGREKKAHEPSPKYSLHWMNVLRWEWLSTYRRLNLIVIFTNIIVIIVFAAQGQLLELSPGAMATAVAANVATAVIFRQEYVVNMLFLIFGCCPPSWPIWIKRLAAKIYHFGGVHSGAGMASIVWLALFDVSLALSYLHDGMTDRDIAILTLTIALNLLLCCVVVTSVPRFREKHHNAWEAIHRFGGWLAIALFWISFGLLADQERQHHRPDESISEMLAKSPTLWLLSVVTISLVMPWLRLRKVPVTVEYQSKYAIRLHFTYTNLPLCAAPRLSISPLRDWHAFAGIPEESGHGFSVLVSGVGDWTKNIVNNPPDQVWVRGIPVRGVLHIAPIFRKVVLVATGSGIGPVLSLLYARDITCRILWSTRDPEITYRPNIVQQVRRADPRAIIITRVRGQPEPHLGSMAYDLVQEIGAEAVFIISNKKGCYESRIWLESRGVVVFTPIFDS